MVRDERGIVVSWLLKIFLSLAVTAVTLFEAGAIIVATVGVDGTADIAAREAAFEFGRTKNEAAARSVAEKSAKQGGGTLEEFRVAQDGRSITVTVKRAAATKIVQHIEPLKKYTTPTATAQSPIR